MLRVKTARTRELREEMNKWRRRQGKADATAAGKADAKAAGKADAKAAGKADAEAEGKAGTHVGRRAAHRGALLCWGERRSEGSLAVRPLEQVRERICNRSHCPPRGTAHLHPLSWP